MTIGYADEDATQPFRDGWLATGDLGHMDDGSLVIDGRKKELLKTSYGKYLNPAKIEARLLTIPGVTNAMVVGEGRPFCAALLWIDGVPTEARRDAVAQRDRRDRPLPVPPRTGEAVGGAPRRPLGRRRRPDPEPQAPARTRRRAVRRRDRRALPREEVRT